ncbi:MAG: hypothetical protein ABSG15_08285 [FCB group bacterium]|jgi:thymidylate kinase
MNDFEKKEVFGLILEGISGSGKTAVLNSILKNDKYLNKSFSSNIVLNEYHTQRIFDNKFNNNTLQKEEILKVLNEYTNLIENISSRLQDMNWCVQDMTEQNLCFIFERFIFSHLNIYPFLKWDDVKDIDAILSKSGSKLCVLTLDENSIEERLIYDRKNIPTWMSYIRRFGNTNNEIVRYFVEQQESLLDFCRQSSMELIQINTSQKNINETTIQIIDFWGINS